ncbi:MAG TPA: hypothetical protein VLI05_05390 [Candidatus Saccharimonadia bacterium]|nr:hypothetical protein [Candidatus Saccharimonadia bacterium]
MAIALTDNLLPWTKDLVAQAVWSNDFAPLADFLEAQVNSPEWRELSPDQIRGLYQLARPVFVERIQRLAYLSQGNHLEAAHRLRGLLDRLCSRGGLNLKAELDRENTGWKRIVYLDRLYGVKRAFEQAEDWPHAQRELADNLLSTDPIKAWEIDANLEEMRRLARAGYQSQVNGWIEKCRCGDHTNADWLQQAIDRLGYSIDDLGITLTELTGWARQKVIDKIRPHLGVSLGSDELSLVLNSAWSLLAMVEYHIAPEEADMDRAALTAARNRLAAWLPQAIRSPQREASGMISADRLRAYQLLILPLFDQVLVLTGE